MTLYHLILSLVACIVAFVLVRPLLFAGLRIAPAVAQQKIQAGEAVLVDVREPGEWKGGVAGPAVLLPASDLLGERRKWKPFLAANKDKELILYCASGIRSGNAAMILRKEGCKTANLGGLGRWRDIGLPMRKV